MVLAALRAALCTPEAFYERGCQEKQLPTSRLPKVKTPRGSQPRFRRDENCDRQSIAGIFHHNTDLSSATEKRAGDLMPTIVLSEPRGLPLFQVVRGGIECHAGPWDLPWANASEDPHPRP